MSAKHRLSVAIAFALVVPLLGVAPQAQAQAQDPGADATTLDTMVVRPQLESQTRALEDKRAADAIQDGVSADTIGQFPDKNVAEALQRLPGISVTRDQGEGRFVVIRGLDAALNSVSIDGTSIGTPEDEVRSATLDVIPSDSTERLTVIKAPTPDMPGDSIGGRIEIESASAFDRDGRDLRLKAEASYNQLSGETSPKVALNYSDLFADGRFGIALGLNYQDRDYESDNVEFEYDENDALPEGELLAVSNDRRKYFINRERLGANLNFDWRPSEDSRYFLRTLYSDFTDAETRQRSVIGLGEGEVTGVDGRVYTIEGIPADEFARRVRFRTKEQSTLSLNAGGEHRLGDVSVDYRVDYTDTRERVGDEVEARFEYAADEDLGAVLDQSRPVPRFDVIDPNAADGWLRNQNYEFDRFVFGPIAVDDDEYGAAVNVEFRGEAVTWKTGLLGRWRERDVDVDELELRAGPDLNLSAFTTRAPGYRFGQLGDGISSEAMRRFLRERGGEYSERPQDVAENTLISTAADYVAEEEILAAYAMATVDLDALRIIAGVRMEHTNFDAVGNAVELDEEGENIVVAPRVAASDYTNLLPGVHLRYDGIEDWVLRGAWTNTISRPAFVDISPRLQINRGDEEVDIGNPQLDPYASSNFDFSAERYLGDSGILSAGVFYKKIDDYIVETVSEDDPEFFGLEVTRRINGDEAEVVGIELNWQQALSQLPGAWSGLLIGASATWLDTEFEVPLRPGETFTLPRASEEIYSAFVGYENFGLSARLAATRRGEYLDAIGDDARFDLYVAANTQLDFTLGYDFSDRWGLFFEASNLLDEPLELYQGSPANVLQQEFYERTYTLGLRARL